MQTTIKPEFFDKTLDFIQRRYPEAPEVGIVLGTGMGGLINCIEIEKELAYNFIPHFPISTVESHFGKLIFGKMSGRRVVAMQGRMHYYEGYNIHQVTYPIRILKMLGIRALFLSNAAGALNLEYNIGDLMVLDDHINLQPENPLRGENYENFGPRFPDMSAPYDKDLITQTLQIAAEESIRMHRGVYVCVQGPNLETRAEYRFLRTIGADVVGMSTVPEVIVANHMGLRTCAISVLTDRCDPDNLEPVTVEEIIEVANRTEPKLTQIMNRLIREFE